MTTRQHTEAQAPATPIAADPVIEPIAYRYDRPVAFYSLAGLVTWLCWVAAGWLSHRTGQGDAVRWATVVLGLAGLAAPVGVAAWLEAHKQNEFKYRPAQDRTTVERFGALTIQVVAGSATNLKITYPDDVAVAERLLASAPTSNRSPSSARA